MAADLERSAMDDWQNNALHHNIDVILLEASKNVKSEMKRFRLSINPSTHAWDEFVHVLFGIDF